jgi:hypothetical protein
MDPLRCSRRRRGFLVNYAFPGVREAQAKARAELSRLLAPVSNAPTQIVRTREEILGRM